MSAQWKAAGLVAGIAVTGRVVAVGVAIGVMVRGGRLIEEAQEECAD